MVRISSLLITLAILLSCAQIGSITGGPKDEAAPTIVKSKPVDGQLNVNTNSIQIEFDEFVVLQKPNENIILLPSNVAYEAKLINKSLILSLKDTLSENTTYSLYLNGAIKDLTEGNDTLIQLVFSTGNELDSNRVAFEVSDAFTGELNKDVVVGLFDSLHSEQPIYFSKTDAKGKAIIRAIADGLYYYSAFDDKNKNRIRDRNEAQFASNTPILIDTSFSDTLKLSLSTPKRVYNTLDVGFISPYILAVRKPHECSFDSISLGSLDVSLLSKEKFSGDSIHYYLPSYFESIQVNFDTLQKKARNAEDINQISLLTSIKKYVLLPEICCLELGFNALLDSITIRPDAFRLFNSKDSTYQDITSNVSIDKNMIRFGKAEYSCENVVFQMDSAAVFGPNGMANIALKTKIQCKTPEDLGVLQINVQTQMGPWYIELVQNGAVKSLQSSLQESERVTFVNLLPGSYSIYVVEDRNDNGKWDPFDPDTFSFPERRFLYPKKVSVKANFEHDIEFIIQE